VRLIDLREPRDGRPAPPPTDLPCPARPLKALAFAPGEAGTLAGMTARAPGRPPALWLWERGQGRAVAACPEAEGIGASVTLAFTADGKTVRVGIRRPGEALVGSWSEGAGWRGAEHLPGGPNLGVGGALSFSPDGETVVAATEAARADGATPALGLCHWPAAELLPAGP
jgi:hypothetical protein